MASWLKHVAKVCRLSGYGVDAWSTFASTLLDGIPRELFDAAESVAESQGLAHVQAFLDWDNFTTWCTVNLNVADHVDQARSAIASLQQTGTVAAYKSAFNILLARLGADNASAGQHVFWWNQGLKPFLATVTAINPLTLDRFTVLADAQRAAVAVESARMPTSAAASGASNLDANANSYKGKGKGKFRQSLHPTQQTRPAEATGHNKGSSFVGNNQQRPATAVASLCDTIPAMAAYMGSFPGKPAPIPNTLAKPIAQRTPNTCWVKGCYGMNPMHCHWQNCPKTAAHFRALDQGHMDTVSTSLPSPPVSKHGNQQRR